MDDYIRRVRLRAYLIWEREGRPEGLAVDHWRSRRNGKSRRKKMLLACKRGVRTTRV